MIRPSQISAAAQTRPPIDTQAGKSSVPPFVRRYVMERDNHRCQAPGCAQREYLGVYHLNQAPDPAPGAETNDPANLVTLCTVCHQLWHIMGRGPLVAIGNHQGS